MGSLRLQAAVSWRYKNWPFVSSGLKIAVEFDFVEPVRPLCRPVDQFGELWFSKPATPSSLTLETGLRGRFSDQKLTSVIKPCLIHCRL
jgi:hypothetical protein